MGDRNAVLKFDGGEMSLPVVEGVEGNSGVDISQLRAKTGLVTLDYGFANTAGTTSAVSFVDGIAGELRYRGYPIEQLAAKSTFLEVAYLLFTARCRPRSSGRRISPRSPVTHFSTRR